MTHAHRPRHPLEWYRDPDGRGIDARLHLLDRQMLDVDGVPVSTVDDVELTGSDGPMDPDHPPVVVAILVGASLLPRVFGGQVPKPEWTRVSWDLVAKLHTAIDLRVRSDELEASWIEQWVRDRIIARIPGGRHDPE